MVMLRIGQGIDFHRIVNGRRLVLGGVEIPWERGLEGHSDADVLLHAVADAVLGAVSAGDIGKWFPPSDERFRDADSGELLRTILGSPELCGWRLVNVDVTMVAEAPRLSEYVPRMRARVAALFGASPSQVSVKATTSEKMGFAGRGEGMAAFAVVLLSNDGNI